VGDKDRADRNKVVAALLELHGRTYAEEVGLDLGRGGPSALFGMLCAAILFSARIRASVAVEAARALAAEGWTSAAKMAETSWEERTRTLNRPGYARYDERTSTMLGEVADLLQKRYGGDVRRLREAAGREPEDERRLLREFKGLGDVGVDIFFREVQLVWEEIHPFADERALRTARTLGLPSDAESLAKELGREHFVRLLAALVRTGLEKDEDRVLERARALAAGD
jgi:hypothetical protein